MIVVRKSTVVIARLIGAAVADLREHIARGYPAHLADWDAGFCTVETVADPVPPTPQEIAAAEAARKEQEDFQNAVLLKLGKALFQHENRIRALEGKAAITAAQFKTAILAL